MIEVIGTVGISFIGILQVANLVQGRMTANKVDAMVSDEQCKERRSGCKREMHIIERKMDGHIHNGSGVKYVPVEVRE